MTSSPSESEDDLGSDGVDSFLRAAAAISPRSLEPERVGEAVGPYRLGRKLGMGAMGTVHAAEDTRLGRTVALKVLRRHALGDASARRRLIREARAAARITHPAIATVFDVGEAGDEVYVAMELVDGVTLRERLQEGPLPVAECASMGLAIASALGAAHQVGVVHRDLKPDNVMVRVDGAVKVLDFGLAQASMGATDEGSTGSADLSADRAVGTPQYMSPEQAKGETVGPTTDVFALGVVLYELLAGRRPFTGASAVAVAIAIDRDPPPPLSRLVPGLPRELEHLILRCLAKNPAERFADAGEVARALDLLSHRSPPSRRLFSLGALAFVVTVGALAWMVGRSALPAAEEPRAEARLPAGPAVAPTTAAPAPAPPGASGSSEKSTVAPASPGGRPPVRSRSSAPPAPPAASAPPAPPSAHAPLPPGSEGGTTIDPLARQK